MAGIYIHIPFCKSKCYYCDFYSCSEETDFSKYLSILKKELEDRRYFVAEEIRTIYFGGGTPSLLSAQQFHDIFEVINKYYKLAHFTEITLEANPDDLSSKYLRDLSKLPFNRLSIGAQSFDNHQLKTLNRRHNIDTVRQSVNDAQKNGFSNISIDIIYGLPNSSTSDLKKELEKLSELNVQHISAYLLTIEENTVFSKLKKKGIISELSEDECFNQYMTIVEWAEKNNFIQYEISNFGKLGRFSMHNSSYWQRIPYLGVGPAAHSYNRIVRRWNVPDLKQYYRYEELEGKIYLEEILTPKDNFNDLILLSLRTTFGLDVSVVESEFGSVNAKRLLNVASKYVESGDVIIVDNVVKLTPKGLFLSDAIIREIFLE